MSKALPCSWVDGLVIEGSRPEDRAYLIDLAAGYKEPVTARLFASLVGSGDTVVDGGAYLGFYTLLAARRVGRFGEVLAFEPNPQTFDRLERNMRKNGYERRVIARRGCIADRSGRRRFHLSDRDGSESSLFPPRGPCGSVPVDCASLDEALGGRAADVVKLDLEGGEVDALRGMSGTVARSPGIRVFIELNPRSLRRAGVAPSALVEGLADLGLEGAAIDEHRRALRPLPAIDVEGIDGHVNLLCWRRRYRTAK